MSHQISHCLSLVTLILEWALTTIPVQPAWENLVLARRMKMGNTYLSPTATKIWASATPSSTSNHKVSWRHPRSKHWHQLDSILNRRPVQSSVKLTHGYTSADCDSDLVSQSSCCRWACITSKRKTRLKSTPIRNALKTKWKSLHKRLRISSQVNRIAMPVRDGNISGMLCAVMPFSSSARR